MRGWAGIKARGKDLLARVLERQVQELRYRHPVTVVAVAGSVGKTTTKLAIAQVLGTGLRVRYQEGNYNDRLTVPLVFFGHPAPSIWNLPAWLRIIGANIAMLEHDYPYDVVVVELGTDAPGQMKQFAYLQPDITVLTAIAEEHMVNFGTLSAVAKEEMAVFAYSRAVLVNVDTVDAGYLVGCDYQSYALHRAADFRAATSDFHLGGQKLQIRTSSGMLHAPIRYLGEQGAYAASAAAAIATRLGLDKAQIETALAGLEPFAGRLQVLRGVKGATLLDDTYNASPASMRAALDVLYASSASQRIAVLGSTNELGDYAREAHEQIGAYCDPAKLDCVVTLGVDAGRWLAPAARDRGCVVESFASQADCASYVRRRLKKQAVVLCKGSQNGVFAEEVVKQLLVDPRDASRLVRQSPSWMRQKRAVRD